METQLTDQARRQQSAYRKVSKGHGNSLGKIQRFRENFARTLALEPEKSHNQPTVSQNVADPSPIGLLD